MQPRLWVLMSQSKTQSLTSTSAQRWNRNMVFVWQVSAARKVRPSMRMCCTRSVLDLPMTKMPGRSCSCFAHWMSLSRDAPFPWMVRLSFGFITSVKR